MFAGAAILPVKDGDPHAPLLRGEHVERVHATVLHLRPVHQIADELPRHLLGTNEVALFRDRRGPVVLPGVFELDLLTVLRPPHPVDAPEDTDVIVPGNTKSQHRFLEREEERFDHGPVGGSDRHLT